MRIALVNYRYFISGGPERYMFNIKELLESQGHEVIPFSVQSKKNFSSKYEHLFLSPIGSGNEVYFSEYKKSFKTLAKGFARMTYSFEAKRTFKKFLKTVKPDVVYILYFQSKISCSIVDAAYNLKIPVIQRISDYSMVAPCNSLYNPTKRDICEDCLHKSSLCAIKNKCIYHSSVYSFVKSLALWVQKIAGTRNKIEKFIFPSSFTLNKYIEGGYPKEKLVYLPTPFNENTLRKDLEISYESFALYIGRIDPDKGLETLIDAFVGTEFKLKIIGFSSVPGFQEKLEEKLNEKRHCIEFLGRMDFFKMQEYLARCLFTVIPSEWYDNLPNTLLESYAFGKCVVATNLGSLSENVENGKTGLLFKYKDFQDLMEKCRSLFKDPKQAIQMGANALKKIHTSYSMENHVKKLEEVFNAAYHKVST